MKNALIVILFFLSIAGCSRPHHGNERGGEQSLQIKGSDTIVNLVQKWAEEYAKEYPGVVIGVTGGGSGTGFAALLNKTCDIAMASRAIEDKEKDQAAKSGIDPKQCIIGLDGLAVVVNPDNPVKNLTMDDLRDIFMAQKTNWKDFGGLDSKIVILSRESNSGTHMFFKEHVLKRGNKKGPEEFSPSALLMPSSQAIADETMQNPHAIGYVGMGYLGKGLKSIAVAKNGTTTFVEPTVDTVLSNSYPISRPLYLYTNGAPTGPVKDFIAFGLSDKGQKIVRETDFVPIIK
ncbi:MAG: phosphate ABC transporter substrate-binding protein [Endomicrobiales bacterium]|jgi:phosphate transport system substrate-binding protein